MGGSGSQPVSKSANCGCRFSLLSVPLEAGHFSGAACGQARAAAYLRFRPEADIGTGYGQRCLLETGACEGTLERTLDSGFLSDCLPDNAGLESRAIIALRATSCHLDRMYNRTLASACK